MFDKVYTMPSSQALIYIHLICLNSTWIRRKNKHTSYRVLLHQFIIQLQYLVSGYNLLLLVILSLNKGLIDLVLVATFRYNVFILPLKVLQELIKCLRNIICLFFRRCLRSILSFHIFKIYLMIIFSNVKFENSDMYVNTMIVKRIVRTKNIIANFVTLT